MMDFWLERLELAAAKLYEPDRPPVCTEHTGGLP